MSKKYTNTFWIALFALPVLTGCHAFVHEEGHLTPNRVQVEEKKFVQETPVNQIDEAYLSSLGAHYERYGDGLIDLSVTYDPKSSVNTAMKASTNVSRLVQSFRTYGMGNVKPNILPVQGQGQESVAVISYMSYTAHAPKDCTLMAGIDSTDVDVDKDYKMGCSVETVFARQISRPKHLMGTDTSGKNADGRRASNLAEPYRGGATNSSLGGESASQ